MPFEKGVSGNPGGRPKTYRAVQDLAREQTERSILVLAEVRDNVEAAPAARVAAAQALLDRGWGKPEVTVTGEIEHSHFVVRMPSALGPKDITQWQAANLLVLEHANQ
jgi:hypothetical protein